MGCPCRPRPSRPWAAPKAARAGGAPLPSGSSPQPLSGSCSRSGNYDCNAITLVIALQSTSSEKPAMASLTIRKLDDAIKAYLRLRSAKNGRSVEEEVRVILREYLEGAPITPPLPLRAEPHAP